MIEKLGNFLIKKSLVILITFSILGFLLGLYSIFNLKVNAELTELAPDNIKEFKDLVKFTEEKVVSNTLLIVVELNNKVNINEVALRIKDAFEKTEYISKAEAFDNPENLIKYGIFTVDENSIDNILGYYSAVVNVEPRSVIDFRFWRNLGVAISTVSDFANDFFSRSGIKKYYLISEDKSLMLMNFSMSKPVTDVNFLNDAIPFLKRISKDISDKFGVNILFSGSAMNNYTGNLQVSKDFQITTFVSLIGISLLLLVSYGSTSSMLFMLYSMILAMGTSLGIIVFLFKEVNIVTSFVNAMLLGLGIDYGIHITAKIHENLRIYGKSTQSIVEAIKENFVPSFVSAITTAISLFALALSPSKPLKEMGISSGIGVLIFYIFMNFLIPALYAKFFSRIRIPKREYFSRFLEFVRKFKPITVFVWVVVLVTGFGAYFAVKNFSYTPPGLVPEKSEAMIALSVAEEKFGDFGIGQVVLGAENFEDLKRLKEKVENSKYFSNTFSILSFMDDPSRLKEISPTFYGKINQIVSEPILDIIFKKYGLYNSLIETLSLLQSAKTFEDVIASIEKDMPSLFFYDSDGKRYYLLYAKEKIGLWTNNNLKKIFDEELKGERVFGYPALFYKVMVYLINSTTKAVYFVFMAIVLTLLIDQRSFKRSLQISFLVILSILSTIGIGYFVLKINLTFLNLLIVPIFLGIGVDSMVHLAHSIKHGRESIMKTEKAVTVSVLTTMMAFGSFMLAQGELLKEFGELVGLGLLISWFVSIFVFLNGIDKN
ncbi:RND transporter [Thermosipho melanesiensis]|uniref:Exporter of the RND superfamily-like protein n=2 Tax=Thermosipho melanesiensis TaxID=46541 RepID=A6LJJ4_THEM4|nr:MMPL family transporter [Thermosipho melanesiensis]ABR30095.1 exporter of the RND superfamily-like protein [Thermosipho melanesiensis BI429]APT73292.1 RND transporter [Thermosipho melanesiensis]OOC38683.1 RND transporter [Thermosipho melanesiensis]OOC40487.1 RND transporter [Thermosipho melanesiensis]OOC40752.1 RND transporter [Thermosipho melanesiensis]